jgi:dTDP-4-dehydrorhamnose reductase
VKVVVLGATGQLGGELCRALADWEVVALTHAEIEICDAARVDAVIGGLAADLVINTAALTNVAQAEQEPVRAFEINALGARNVAQVCARANSALMYISTDYIFDGEKGSPYVESDSPSPLNVYGVTKLAGEYFVRAIAKRWYIVRTSGLYGERPCRGKQHNFVQRILRLAETGTVKVVSDQFSTPTSAADLARQIRLIVEKGKPGLYHATNAGQCSWHEFARLTFELTGTKVDLIPITTAEYGGSVRRPRYSVLENAHLKQQGLDIMRPWREALAEYLQRIGAIR